MYKRDKTSDSNVDHSNVDQKKTTDERNGHGTNDDVTDIREANENIRKAQGEDSGHRPTIDRHR